MYTEKVMDHFQHPRNVGELENASGVGTVGNAKCGDIMRIYLDIDENQIIRDVTTFLSFWMWGGCSNKQYGDRTCKREKYSGGNESNKQSCDGGS